MKTAVILGASGDVGTGIAGTLLADGYRVVAVGRRMKVLRDLQVYLTAGEELTLLAGSVGTQEAASALARQIVEICDPDAIIATVNGNASATALLDLSLDDLEKVTEENIAPHLFAARAFIPRLKPGATYLGIGGGMADLIVPRMTAISMAQAAQRILYRYLAREKSFGHVNIRELLLHAMISGRTRPGTEEAHWISAEDVGRHVAAVLSDLETFAGPILNLKSRKQITLPERVSAA